MPAPESGEVHNKGIPEPRLVRLTCELRHGKPMGLLRAHEDVFRKIMGRERDETQRWFVPGLRMEIAERKEIVIVDEARTIIEIQEPTSVQHAQETVRQRVDTIAESFEIPELRRWGCRTVWIAPHSQGSIEQLKQTFIKRVFREFPLASTSTDSAFVLEFQEPQSKTVTVRSGPMWPEQLKNEYLRMASHEYPDAFVLIDVDLGMKQPPTFSRQVLGRFLQDAVSLGSKYADACVNVILED